MMNRTRSIVASLLGFSFFAGSLPAQAFINGKPIDYKDEPPVYSFYSPSVLKPMHCTMVFVSPTVALTSALCVDRIENSSLQFKLMEDEKLKLKRRWVADKFSRVGWWSVRALAVLEFEGPSGEGEKGPAGFYPLSSKNYEKDKKYTFKIVGASFRQNKIQKTVGYNHFDFSTREGTWGYDSGLFLSQFQHQSLLQTEPSGDPVINEAGDDGAAVLSSQNELVALVASYFTDPERRNSYLYTVPVRSVESQKTLERAFRSGADLPAQCCQCLRDVKQNAGLPIIDPEKTLAENEVYVQALIGAGYKPESCLSLQGKRSLDREDSWYRFPYNDRHQVVKDCKPVNLDICRQ